LCGFLVDFSVVCCRWIPGIDLEPPVQRFEFS
jgi:hypothetical protein